MTVGSPNVASVRTLSRLLAPARCQASWFVAKFRFCLFYAASIHVVVLASEPTHGNNRETKELEKEMPRGEHEREQIFVRDLFGRWTK
jgi:hypothetical protein